MAESTQNFNAVEITNDLVNAWLDETRGLPVTLQLSKLSFKIIEALQNAYTHGHLDTEGVPLALEHEDLDVEFDEEDALDFETMVDDFNPYMPPRYDVEHPSGETQNCPECNKPMIFAGVVFVGNIQSVFPADFKGRWDCPECNLMLATDIDQVWAEQQWEKQQQIDAERRQ